MTCVFVCWLLTSRQIAQSTVEKLLNAEKYEGKCSPLLEFSADRDRNTPSQNAEEITGRILLSKIRYRYY